MPTKKPAAKKRTAKKVGDLKVSSKKASKVKGGLKIKLTDVLVTG